ncbi:thioredoxin family protein [Porticoccaceae bacterium LTM1]|nr:thioredoxin family protein [Porticoccaceae bacterium LTM1]
MLKQVSKALASVALMAIASTALAEKGEQWLTDMDEAQKVAKAEGKDIFMFFTGSDWCGWCIKLDNEVLSKQEFLDYAKDNLVLVDLDFPQGEDIITEEQREHNEKWQDVFKPRGYPTVYLTDYNAKGYAQTGYREGGPVKYVEHLEELISGKAKAKKLKIKAAKASGLKRAKLLDELLSNDSLIIEDRDAKMAEIMSLSQHKDDALYSKYRTIKGGQDMMAELNGLRGDKGTDQEKVVKQVAIFNKYNFIKEGGDLSMLLYNLCFSFHRAGMHEDGLSFFSKLAGDSSYPLETRQDFVIYKALVTAGSGQKEAATELLDQAISMDPESQSAKMKDRILSQIDSLATKS